MRYDIYNFKCPKCNYTVGLVRPTFAPAPPLANCSKCLATNAELVALVLVETTEGITAKTSEGVTRLGPHPNVSENGDFSWSNAFNRKK